MYRISDSLDKTLKAKFTKEQIGKQEFVKMKNYCSSKSTLQRMQRQAMYWENNILKYIFDK